MAELVNQTIDKLTSQFDASLLVLPGALGLAVSVWADKTAFGDGSQRPCPSKQKWLRVSEGVFALILLAGVAAAYRKYSRGAALKKEAALLS